MSSEAVLSESEKTYILHSVEANFRCDGRKRNELRPVVLETGVVSHASGSAHLRLANTDILVGVKAELEAPLPGALNQGRLEFFVDCSGFFFASLLSQSILSSFSPLSHSVLLQQTPLLPSKAVAVRLWPLPYLVSLRAHIPPLRPLTFQSIS